MATPDSKDFGVCGSQRRNVARVEGKELSKDQCGLNLQGLLTTVVRMNEEGLTISCMLGVGAEGNVPLEIFIKVLLTGVIRILVEKPKYIIFFI